MTLLWLAAHLPHEGWYVDWFWWFVDKITTESYADMYEEDENDTVQGKQFCSKWHDTPRLLRLFRYLPKRRFVSTEPYQFKCEYATHYDLAMKYLDKQFNTEQEAA